VGGDDSCGFLCFGNSVGKAAMDMVYEVRRQFKEIPELWNGKQIMLNA
jgi:Na+/H+-translocating membrane pyrophosphatase